jgi:hypothetical protein
MLYQAYRLLKATAAVAQGVTRQVCKVLPEDSVIVLEGANDDGKTVNVRCGTEKLWMFTRDLVGALRAVPARKSESLPADLTLVKPPEATNANACVSCVVPANGNQIRRSMPFGMSQAFRQPHGGSKISGSSQS